MTIFSTRIVIWLYQDTQGALIFHNILSSHSSSTTMFSKCLLSSPLGVIIILIVVKFSARRFCHSSALIELKLFVDRFMLDISFVFDVSGKLSRKKKKSSETSDDGAASIYRRWFNQTYCYVDGLLRIWLNRDDNKSVCQMETSANTEFITSQPVKDNCLSWIFISLDINANTFQLTDKQKWGGWKHFRGAGKIKLM